MNKLITIFSLIVASIGVTKAQKNTVYLEVGGNAAAYSLNYDRIIAIDKHVKLAPRIGAEIIPRPEAFSSLGKWSFPFELNMLYSNKENAKNFAEIGLGLSLFSMLENTYVYDDGSYSASYEFGKTATVRLGFRHQKPEGGLTYRAGILFKFYQDKTSLSNFGDDIFLPIPVWPGVSIGYSF